MNRFVFHDWFLFALACVGLFCLRLLRQHRANEWQPSNTTPALIGIYKTRFTYRGRIFTQPKEWNGEYWISELGTVSKFQFREWKVLDEGRA